MKPVLTIDGPHSLDLDDGVWAEPEGDRLRLTIAIDDRPLLFQNLGNDSLPQHCDRFLRSAGTRASGVDGTEGVQFGLLIGIKQ